MQKWIAKGIGLAFGALLFIHPAAQAAPATFYFTFQDPNGPAQATGFVTFEETLLPNPAACGFDFNLPDPAVLALEVTVSGAASGNGTFVLKNFQGIAWCTNGATLDLSTELVGQATPGDPWGTPNVAGNGGDFNLFGPPPSPNGDFYFTLCANGSRANCMILTSMIAGPLRLPPPPAPALSPLGIVALSLALMAIGGMALYRRSTA